jgi:hypothetical protein
MRSGGVSTVRSLSMRVTSLQPNVSLGPRLVTPWGSSHQRRRPALRHGHGDGRLVRIVSDHAERLAADALSALSALSAGRRGQRTAAKASGAPPRAPRLVGPAWQYRNGSRHALMGEAGQQRYVPRRPAHSLQVLASVQQGL